MHNQIDTQTMRERRGWTQRQDQVLKLLIEVRGEVKWSTIARIMQQQFFIAGKSGKQCRQRYHNHLKSTISNSGWSSQQDKQLLRLHEEFGNKWSIISQNLLGRSQNCVKNHFYSKLRKVVRRLNRLKAESSRQGTSDISTSLLSKIISVSESRFKLNPKISEGWMQYSMGLIKKLYNYEQILEDDSQDQQTNLMTQKLLNDISYFQINFKKKKSLKKDINEADYMQRTKPSYRKNQRNKAFSMKETSIKGVRNDQKVDTQNNSTQFADQKTQPQENLNISLQKFDIKLLNEDNQKLKNVDTFKKDQLDQLGGKKFNTFESFCELDFARWNDDKMHVLQQSQGYDYCQVQYLLEP